MSTETVVFRVEGMHCGSCSMLIDDTLEDVPGVSDSHTEFKAARSTVTLDTTRTDAQQVIDAIAAVGYTMTPQP
jgi:copper chaperone CopZ